MVLVKWVLTALVFSVLTVVAVKADVLLLGQSTNAIRLDGGVGFQGVNGECQATTWQGASGPVVLKRARICRLSEFVDISLEFNLLQSPVPGDGDWWWVFDDVTGQNCGPGFSPSLDLGTVITTPNIEATHHSCFLPRAIACCITLR